MFIDEVKVYARAGKGGAGAVHFRREKYVPEGGPDGGDGGKGGSVILIADTGKRTLLDFQYKKDLIAKQGGNGGKNRKDGGSGDDLVFKVPIGTQVINPETKEILVDLDYHEKSFSLATGGQGGKGNYFFKSATNRVPEYAQPGKPGTEGEFILSLKLLADVGLLGLPNAGKSTFLSSVTTAKPKIASYPFTTLDPNLGVVKQKNFSFVIADIPGLIPGAHKGKGLGINFLKHLERNSILLHLIDPYALDETGELKDPLKSFNEINNELNEFSEKLSSKTQIICFTKADLNVDTENNTVKEAMSVLKKEGFQVFEISSVSRKNIDTLLDYIGKLLT